MLAKMTCKNQITLPQVIAKQFGATYFDIRSEEELGIKEQDIADAVAWARR